MTDLAITVVAIQPKSATIVSLYVTIMCIRISKLYCKSAQPLLRLGDKKGIVSKHQNDSNQSQADQREECRIDKVGEDIAIDKCRKRNDAVPNDSAKRADQRS